MKSHLVCTIALLALAPLAHAAKPRIVFNDDAQVLFESPSKGATKFLKGWMDREIKAVPFTTFVFLAATPDVCTYATKVGEVYGDRFGPKYTYGWTKGIRGLRDEGTDALKVVTQHMHANGKEVLAAIRMNDTHHRSINRNNPLCPLFAVKYPHFVIKQPDGRTNETALDYSHAKVRDHRFGIMKEIATEYDVDGLELNFVRWAKHFPRDKGRENAPIMTAYIGRIHKMLAAAAKKRGRKRLTLGVRVPESIHACWLAAVDIETWVKRGWIDYVVISTWNNTDPQLRVDEFSKFTKPAGIDTIVVMGNMIGSLHSGPPMILDRPIAMSAKHRKNYVGMLLTADEARGAAANYYTWGGTSISFWNVGIQFGSRPTAAPAQRARIARWTQAVKSKETVFAGRRTYRYLPMGKGISSRKPPVRSYPWYDEGHSALGHRNSPILTLDKKHTGKRLVFPFRMADGRKGERLAGRMTFWVYHLTPKDTLHVDLNGKRISASKIIRVASGKRRGGLPGQRISVALQDCPAFRGGNELGLTLKNASTASHAPYMEELEVVVNASSGKQAAKHKPLKIFIAVDSEGPTGVAEYWARNLKAGNPRLRKFREQMTADVNAAVEGCLAAGAAEVYVKDDGFRDRNLIVKLLDKRAKLLPSGPKLMHGLDKSFGGVMLVGFHTMEGAKDGVLAHTWSSGRRRRYWFNGKKGGEVAAYAIVAGHDHRVPIVMATGCKGLCREVNELLGKDVVTVPVKHKRADGSIDLYPPSVTSRSIFLGAIRAVRTIEQRRPYIVKFPLQVRLQLKDKSTTDGYVKWRQKNKPDWPGRRSGANILEATLRTTKHIVF